MLSPKRILAAVTLRRVVAVLLLGAFAEEISSFLRWLWFVGWELFWVATLRACLLAGLVFALDACLIYLALRGLESLLERRRVERVMTAAERPPMSELDETALLDEFDEVSEEAFSCSRVAGGGGVGRELR